jgi:probable F420-dependent oxidoreductase
MDVGVLAFATDYSIGLVDVASAVEERGFESFFLAEHTHIPVDRRTPFVAGGPLPDHYKHLWDPFVALAHVAGQVPRVLLGTCVCVVSEHDPIVLAKTVASVDRLSGGRLVLGIGFGWNREELENHGVDPRHKRAVAREKVLAMKALWTEPEAGFEGEFVRIERSWSWPKPLQAGGPPVLLGAQPGPRTFGDVVEWADGWLPYPRPGLTADIAELRRRAEDAGRDPATIRVNVAGGRADPAEFERLAALGVERVIMAVPTGEPGADPGDVLRRLDRIAEAARRSGAGPA